MNNMKKQRIVWIDVAKALLITCVIVTHLPAFAQQNGITCFNWMEILRPWFGSYFMCAFFIITGYCDAMRGSFGNLLVKNLKLLMLPNFLVSIGIPMLSYLISRQTNFSLYLQTISEFFLTGGFWFLSSLFFSKLIFWLICYINKSNLYRLCTSLAFLVIGVLLHDIGVENIWFFQNIFIAVFFLGLGHSLRLLLPIENYQISIWRGNKVRLFYVGTIVFVAIVLASLCFNFGIPSMSADLYISMFTLPLFILVAITGSLFCYTIAHFLSPNRVLQYIGRETIVVYLFHMYFLLKFLPAMKEVFSLSYFNYLVIDITSAILLVIATLLFCTVMNLILNTKYLKFILGKF